MAKKNVQVSKSRERRTFTDEFKQEAVQMLLDGHSVASVSKNLGIGNANLLYRWKADSLARSGPAAKALDSQVIELREELQRTRRERDILKKALSIFSQQE
jgi:transposase